MQGTFSTLKDLRAMEENGRKPVITAYCDDAEIISLALVGGQYEVTSGKMRTTGGSL